MGASTEYFHAVERRKTIDFLFYKLGKVVRDVDAGE